MTQRLEGLNNRPTDFDLVRYTRLESLPLRRWMDQVSLREELLTIDAPLTDLEEISDLLLRAPIAREEKGSSLYLRKLDALRRHEVIAGRQGTAVRPMTMQDARSLSRWVQARSTPLADLAANCELKRAGLQPLDDENREAQAGWTTPNMATLVVNLDSPPDVLAREFKEWQMAARKVHGISFKGFKVNRSDWCAKRLIPFLDLELWARSRDARFTDEALAEMLFPDNFDRGGRYVGQTVRPAACRLLNDRMCGRILDEVRRDGSSSL